MLVRSLAAKDDRTLLFAGYPSVRDGAGTDIAAK